jgi:hypothetical protein
MTMQAVYDWHDNLMEGLDRLNEAEGRMQSAKAYFLGLDLGQAADYSALAILERQPRASSKEPPVFHCRHLQRWPLKTPYPQIVEDVYNYVDSDDLQKRESDREEGWSSDRPTLAIDATGVGAPVVDLFNKAFSRSEQSLRVVEDRSPLPLRMAARVMRARPVADVTLRPIQITGGDQVTKDGQLTRVPKRDLVSAAQVALQTERLKVAAELPEAQTLTRELQNFQVKISLDTAHDSYGAWRDGAHDDLVLAVALALWVGQNSGNNNFFYF